MDARGRESANSCFRILSPECVNDHLLATLTMGSCVVKVQAMSDAARSARRPRNTGEENMWSNPGVRIHLHVMKPNTGLSSGNFSK
uniref:Uncharacterized protein n=1 Tax=Arundo donax TaxID=35708 RepID=A0A0A9H7B8_ARUDO